MKKNYDDDERNDERRLMAKTFLYVVAIAIATVLILNLALSVAGDLS